MSSWSNRHKNTCKRLFLKLSAQKASWSAAAIFCSTAEGSSSQEALLFSLHLRSDQCTGHLRHTFFNNVAALAQVFQTYG